MGTRRLGIALVAAFIISVGITSVFYIRVTRAEAAARTKTRRIVAAAVALQPGTPVAVESLTEINWPENVPLEGLIEKKEDVTGHILAYAIAAKEPVLRRDLAANASFGLAAKIPDGMRAVAVKTNEVMNIAGFIFPGSRVDVLVTLREDNNNSASSSARTVLQNVQVLSTGTKIDPDPNGKPDNVGVVTLLVTPEQSEKLELAQSQGTIQFVLRNSGDSLNPDTPAVDMYELRGMPKKLPPAKTTPKKASAPAAPKPPADYIVETVAKGKVTIAKFPEGAQ